MATVEIHPKNKLNELTASEWIARTVSVFVQKGLGKNSDEAKFEKLHPAPFSFTDVTRFVEFFTKRKGSVIDPFGGVGSSAKAAALLERHATIVEIDAHFAELSRQRLTQELPDGFFKKYCTVICSDIRKADFGDEVFDLILTSPPYWGILDKIDHKAKQERLDQGLQHNYGDNEGDLSNIGSYEEFVDILSKIFTELSGSVRDGGHAVIIVGDFRHKSKYHMFHSDLANALEKMGAWSLKGIKVMYQKHKRVFPYGYPYSYVPNLHHQYALIFQKSVK